MPEKSKGEFARALERLHGVGAYEAARQLACQLHDEHKVHGPPFVPRHFANLLGIDVREADIEAEGVLTNVAAHRRLCNDFAEEGQQQRLLGEFFAHEEEENAPRILLRRLKPSEGISAVRRRTFTLAHEIGHHVLRRDVCTYWNDFRSNDPEEESLCHEFAKELLMPRFRIQPDLERYGVSPPALLYLSDRYAVSLQALLCRAIAIAPSIFGETIVSILWRKSDDGLLTTAWVEPKHFRRAIVCDTGGTPIESAFESPGSQVREGKCDLLLDGQRSRWQALALRLPASNLVLSVLRARRTNRGRQKERRIEARRSGARGPSGHVQATFDMAKVG